MATLVADLRYGARLLLRNPGFALITILALALGIGANTAIFSAVDAVLLRPLPFADPDRLVFVWEDASHVGFPRNTPAPANYYEWLRQNQVFTDMAALRLRTASLTGDGPPEFVIGQGATANLFSVLGVTPLFGRGFTEEEDSRGASVVVISYGLWQRRYGGDRGLVGRKILMDGMANTVVGIMPRGFHFPERPMDFWVPAHFTPQERAMRNSHFLRVVARMKPGVRLETARAEMTTIARRLEREYPNSNARIGAVVVALQEQLVGSTRAALLVLLAAAGCVLLIACANIANLLLARSAGRQREMAVRAALGAGRARLIRQTITESVLVSLAGGCLGLLLARWSLRLLQTLVPAGVPGVTLALDGRLLAFTFAVSVLTGVIFGMAPAIQAGRLSLHDALKQAARGAIGGRSAAFRDVLVVAEVALALVLLVGAGLMVRTLANLRAIEVGFRSENLLTMRTRLPFPKYADAGRRWQYYDAVLAKVRALPGVQSAAFVSNLPFTARGNTNGFRIEGRPDPGPGNMQDALFRSSTLDYPKTIGVGLLAGRLFGDQDRAGSPPAVIINDTFARQYWPGESPLGKRIQLGNDPWLTIIGVVADVLERGLEETLKPGVYVLAVQNPNRGMPQDLVIRTAVNPLGLAGGVREAIWSVDRDQPISQVRTMQDIVELDVADRRQQMALLGSFAALALLMASLGIYGVLAYAVSQRTREIGVRMAMGASAGGVLRMVVGHGMRLALAGLAAGGIAAFVLTRAMARLLYGVAPADPRTFTAVSAILLAVALLACAVPASRASRVDPMVALREE